MKTWQIPEPPGEEVERVRDREGRVYADAFGDREYWFSDELGYGRGTYSWVDLLAQRGPVTAVES